MSKQFLALLLAAFVALPGTAADREVIRATWQEFREQLKARGLAGRGARVSLSNGKSVSTEVREAGENGLTVRETGATRQWHSAPGEASIPKAEITSVRFTGREGKGRLIGTVAGLSAGAGLGAAVATNTDVNEGPGIIVIPIIGAGIAIVGAVGGYFAGRSQDRPRPEFVLTR